MVLTIFELIKTTGPLHNITNNHTYRADDRLLYIIINLTQRLKRICYACDFILLIYTYVLYNMYLNNLIYFAYWEVGMILLLGFIQNRVVVPKGSFVIKIAIEISFTTEHIFIKTPAFKGPLWFKRDPLDIQLNRAQTTIEETANPYPNIFKLDSPLIKITHGSQKFYIMSQYYTWRLEEDLKQP